VRVMPRRVLLAAVVANSVLIVAGVFLVPATVRSLEGLGIIAADIGLQVAIAVVGLFGPVSLGRLGDAAGWCLAVGSAFALAYLGLLLFDFAGHPLALSPYEFFVAAALAGSIPVALRRRRVISAVLAAAWSLVLGLCCGAQDCSSRPIRSGAPAAPTASGYATGRSPTFAVAGSTTSRCSSFKTSKARSSSTPSSARLSESATAWSAPVSR